MYLTLVICKDLPDKCRATQDQRKYKSSCHVPAVSVQTVRSHLIYLAKGVVCVCIYMWEEE